MTKLKSSFIKFSRILSVNNTKHTIMATVTISFFTLFTVIIFILNDAKVCLLCFLQQTMLLIILTISFLGRIFYRNKKIINLYYYLSIVTISLGLIIDIWQIYLQLNPVYHTCGLSAQQLFSFLPFWEFLIQILSSVDCSDMVTFLSIPLTICSATIFIVLLFINSLGLYFHLHKSNTFNNNKITRYNQKNH